MPKKFTPIRYTSRDFDTIKTDLIEYARRYYPNTFKDFNQASFGALMLDLVSYVGDILSFNLDYQANESFLDTALEYDNVVKIANQMGYKHQWNPASQGILSLFIRVPATSDGSEPDRSYMPVLKRGSRFESNDGISFILDEDVDFSDPGSDIVVAQTNTEGVAPTHFAIKAYGKVSSGVFETETHTVGDFQKFLKIKLNGENITEVTSIIDGEGHEYFEVDHLAQNVVYRAVNNKGSGRITTPNLLKPFIVPRRFTTERDRTDVYIQFGHGTDSEIFNESVADPSSVVLDMHGRDYIAQSSFDPAKLISTDKFGIAPASTVLQVTYRRNTTDDVNASVEAVNVVAEPRLEFDNPSTLTANTMIEAIDSLECTNEERITGDVGIPSLEELKVLIKGYHAAQNRAVTREDYRHLIYAMPDKFGKIKRCQVLQDNDSFKRNLNLYVISENKSGNLVKTAGATKDNIRTWLSTHKMINDTIDILDAHVVNVGVSFEIIAGLEFDRFDVLQRAAAAVQELFRLPMDIGEPLWVTDIYRALNDVEGVVDTVFVKITRPTGAGYSDVFFNIKSNMSADGRLLTVPDTFVLEVKAPGSDISGVVK